ncbi:pumilio homolog 12-like [Solanum pennellii]|uniref:Pumilio homolog 12-like n=1 Tax=Solanum pennellii TaxID=28526 RepID=A0ABM1GM45_SOLPN|nr:pumilio homolog 12-like [Solanum pennellii]
MEKRSPENNSGHQLNRNGFQEFHPRSVTNSGPPLESLFGSLRLDDEQVPLPSFGVPSPAAGLYDDEILTGFRAQETLNNGADLQGLIRAQNAINGAHQNLTVGPNILNQSQPLAAAGGGVRSQPWYYSEPSSPLIDNDYLRLNYELPDYNGYSLAAFGGVGGGGFLPNTAPLMSYRCNNGIMSNNFRIGSPISKYNQIGSELRGNMVALAKDQQGSKLLQSKLDKGNNEEIGAILSELIGCVSDLMKNQSGSYVIQKLFAVCNEQQRTTIIQAITRNTHQFIGICFSQHGARAMQKLLDNILTPHQIYIILSAIAPVAVALANDQSGQHVIQFCVKTYPPEYIRPLLCEIANNCFAIATQKSGCCVIQSCVESAGGELRDCIIAEILTNAVQLSEDQYGNYVVQHLVGLKLPRVTDILIDRLQGNFLTLSCNKYASNVVEKIILESGDEHSTRIITELLSNPSGSMLLMDPYGNFVIQSSLQRAKGILLEALYNLIDIHAASMKSNMYGKKVLDRLASRKEQMHCTRLFMSDRYKLTRQ